MVKNHAVAINPLYWMKQVGGNFMYGWLKYPFVLGSDLAGEVVGVGASVSRFKVGDRVIGQAVGMDKKRNRSAEGAFQEYTVLLAHMAAPIPDSLAYERAAVLPLGLSTAACGLFEKDQLALNHPSANPKPTGKTLLIWGGSTSVGSSAIQLAVAAGYEVITTCLPRNFDYVKKLGASQAFDYNSPTVVSDISKAFQGKTSAGALAIGQGSTEACLDILPACQGNKFVSIASFPIDFQQFTQGLPILQFLRQVPKIVGFIVSMLFKARTRRIGTNFIFGTTLMNNEVSQLIYADFLPRALAEGQFVATPAPHVIGKHLGFLQAALDAQRQGVSAQKVVVSL
ncbi:zinc-binding alcohol dehydrogenase family protein [Hymenobacter cavernae]|uniref:NADPH:quinone reductase n=1 Tax=Hymenobacter cavernae TaxID=2044852 RepID=A0ABQ1UCI0_9BACT|nr:zinc-binding alcohol dehydrogenase family protein [Hymenobacter cavernae]GGF14131.1 NADPH:quinone reductase [Hymenobacter cavernae]